MVDDPLSGLLHELHDAGVTDSSGFFTLDVRRTLEKLRRFALAEPRDYVLNVYAAAVASGATRFWAQLDSEVTVLSFDGTPFAAADLESLFQSLLQPSAAARLRELATAVLGAQALEPRSLLLESWGPSAVGGHRGARLEMDPGRLVVTSLREPPWKQPDRTTRLQLSEKRLGLTQRLFRGKPASVRPEVEALTGRCCYGPSRLEINGHAEVAPARGALAQLQVVGRGSDWLPWLNVTGLRTGQLEGLPAVLGIAPGGGPPEVYYFVHGVAWPQPGTGLPPGLKAWVEWPGLEKDLSQGHLVMNEAWQEANRTLREQSLDCLRELLSRPEADLESLVETVTWLLGEEQWAEDLPLFDLADGSRATMGQLRESNRRYGAIYHGTAPGCGRFGDGTPILAGQPWAKRYLLHAFSSHSGVLPGPRPVATTLPPGTPRLVGERTLSQQAGGNSLVALTPRSPNGYFRVLAYWNDRASEHLVASDDLDLPVPNGVELVVRLRPDDSRDPVELARVYAVPKLYGLYQQLLWSDVEEERALRGELVLECFAKAAGLLKRQLAPGSPWGRLSGARQDPSNPLHALVQILGLESLARQALIRDGQNGWVCLEDLALRGPYSVEELAVTPRQAQILRDFLPRDGVS